MPGMTQHSAVTDILRDPASMRPRLNAGDDRLGIGIDGTEDPGFNEAPAKCRG